MARSFDEIRKLATLPTRTVALCLAGELVEQHAQLERRLADTPPPANLGDTSRRDIAEQIVALEEQMEESTVDFHLKAMGAKVWTLFWGTMPTRREKESDEAWGERIFPFYCDMVSRSCVDPVMTADEVGELVEALHAKAWNNLLGGCLALNNGEIDVPNSAAASEVIGSSEQT